MTLIEKLNQQNETFAETQFTPGLKMMPSLKTMVIGCVDPRVDPFELFGVKSGELASIRNVGGRIYPSTLQTMGMLRIVSKAQGNEIGKGWNLIVLHHTDCGINCLAHQPGLLSKHFDIPAEELEAKAIADPRRSVEVDVAALKANPNLPAELLVTGMVYDVSNGRVETVVPTSLLRPEGA